jgi:hypothetical protein
MVIGGGCAALGCVSYVRMKPQCGLWWQGGWVMGVVGDVLRTDASCVLDDVVYV